MTFRDRKTVHDFTARVMADFPVIDILVANAGTMRRSPVAEHTDENWDEVIEVNLNSQFVLSRDFGKRMVERGSGKIIFIASLLSFQGGILVPSYAASKGGIAQLTKALANEWAPKGVQVNAICPGYIAHRPEPRVTDRPGKESCYSVADSRGPLGLPRRFARRCGFSCFAGF